MTSSRPCLYLLNIYHFTYTCSHAHIEARTHKHTCIISTQEEWRQPGTGAWSGGAEEGVCKRQAEEEEAFWVEAAFAHNEKDFSQITYQKQHVHVQIHM